MGNEGYIGIPILHQVGVAAYRVTVQLPMKAFRIKASRFSFESNREGAFRTLLSETQLVQAVICSLTHTVEQRARRLLVMSRRLQSDTFEITQQLSIILDRHRNRVSEATIVLRERGLD